MTIDFLRTYACFSNETLLHLTRLENQGYNNTNYCLIGTQQSYLVRVFGHNALERKHEFKIAKKAFVKGIAQKPLLLDRPNNLMIARFGEGVHHSKLTQKELQNLARTLRTLHSIAYQQKPYDMSKAYKKPLQKRAFLLFKKLHMLRKDYVLCHHDLNPKNILFHQHNITFIDWEYARINDRYFDLASICVEFNLTKKEIYLFLRTYFTCKEKYDLKKLDLYKKVYNIVCETWFDEHFKERTCPNA
ncbi:MAG: aminoglycoside phosphotransferase [Epsilonproteobacteria bacterium]|nr:aminoglycoside phosphotransferase [Campylobacterota bacterium]